MAAALPVWLARRVADLFQQLFFAVLLAFCLVAITHFPVAPARLLRGAA